jgi:hypothetical protein
MLCPRPLPRLPDHLRLFLADDGRVSVRHDLPVARVIPLPATLLADGPGAVPSVLQKHVGF